MTTGSPQSGVGRIIAGRYMLLHQIGSGGMGHVWLAHDQRLDCDVALKEIRFRHASEGPQEHEARVARALAEARHAAVLRGHPHVVTVHDVTEHEGLPWIVMEHIEGAEDLRALLSRRGPLAPDECARAGLAVLDALTAGHERGIMHRDVKPANILLAPDRSGSPGSRILLTDYGISVQPDSQETRWTRTSVLVGTPGYLAPERATGGPPTAAADLFSLGCTLYFAVEGFGPFDRDSNLAALTAVVLEEPRPPLRAGALQPLIEGLLVKNPAHRLSAEDTAAALARIITPDPHPPTHLDTGSQPHWAGLDTSDPPPGPEPPGRGFGPPVAYTPTSPDYGGSTRSAPWANGFGTPGALPPQGYGPPTPGTPPGAGFGPPWSGELPRPAPTPPPHRRKRPRALQALAAAVVALGLTFGGVWYAMANKTELPYGSQIGLSKPLKERDCVVVDFWSGGAHLSGTPRLKTYTTCDQEVPDGQVMALFEADSREQALRDGQASCDGLTEVTREKLAENVKSLPVIPSSKHFDALGGKVACLLIGKHGPVYGHLGPFRSYGTAFVDPAQMQKDDCLGNRGGDGQTITHYKLVACDKEHQEKVVEITHLTSEVPDAEANAKADEQCEKDAPVSRFTSDDQVYRTHGIRSGGLWEKGYYLVVCTIERMDKGTIVGDL
ncbi:serine/threonine-protein kinase [Streptomyces sp. NPDC050704]|uniref:serine/threonine-protein kinase n=1 Tax=Streptomyces sp. NPDC050704 TaxID=3157219 RepID=UPI003416DB9A